MRDFPFSGTGIVILAALIIFLCGLLVLGMGFMAATGGEDSYESSMGDGNFTVTQLQEPAFGDKISVDLVFSTPPQPGNTASLYFVNKESYDRFMDWVREEGDQVAAEKIHELEFIYQQNCSENCDFAFTAEDTGEFYLIMVNHGEEQELRVRVKREGRSDLGVCFVLFLMMAGFGVLMMKAGLRLKQRPQVYNYHNNFDRKFNY